MCGLQQNYILDEGYQYILRAKMYPITNCTKLCGGEIETNINYRNVLHSTMHSIMVLLMLHRGHFCFPFPDMMFHHKKCRASLSTWYISHCAFQISIKFSSTISLWRLLRRRYSGKMAGKIINSIKTSTWACTCIQREGEPQWITMTNQNRPRPLLLPRLWGWLVRAQGMGQ